MKDHDETRDELDGLLPAFVPGSPFADEIERLLSSTGGPVAVDESELESALDRLEERVQPSVRPRSRQWIAAPIALLAVAAALLFALRPAPAPSTAPVPTPVEYVASTAAVHLGPTGDARVLGDALWLDAGSVRFQRDEGHSPDVAEVFLPEDGLRLVPVGTTFVAGRSGSCAALSVREGRVEVRAEEVLIDEVSAGGWWLRCDGDQRAWRDGDVVALESPADELLAELRWLALPEETRSLLER